jgi:uncharacterized protein (DUF486 family)
MAISASRTSRGPKDLGLFSIVLISWGMAFFEYVLQVPANRIGHVEQWRPRSPWCN